MEQSIEIISWLAAIQGILLVIALASRKTNSRANRLLSLYILIITGDCLEPILHALPESILKTAWQFLWGGLIFLHGPLLFLYVKTMLSSNSRLLKKDIVHLLLPLVYFGLVMVLLLLGEESTAGKIWVIALHEFFFVHLLGYAIASVWHLNKHQSISLTGTSMQNLRWLKRLVWLTVILYAFSFVTVQVSLVNPTIAVKAFNLTIQVILITVMYVISYQSMAQPQLFGLQIPIVKNPEVIRKYQKSSLGQLRAQEIESKLLHFMDQHKPFLDPDLSLETLAASIGESKYHVSQVINSLRKKSFHEFVNTYRVEQFKKLALKPSRRRQTIQALSRQAGFSSKTAFHTVFKKITGQTPTQFFKGQSESKVEL
jgi:AraC-like DNA-binding protein